MKVSFPDLNEFLLFCYTDGLTETVNEANQEFWCTNPERLFLEANHYKDLKTIHQYIIVALDGFKGGRRLSRWYNTY